MMTWNFLPSRSEVCAPPFETVPALWFAFIREWWDWCAAVPVSVDHGALHTYACSLWTPETYGIRVKPAYWTRSDGEEPSQTRPSEMFRSAQEISQLTTLDTGMFPEIHQPVPDCKNHPPDLIDSRVIDLLFFFERRERFMQCYLW